MLLIIIIMANFNKGDGGPGPIRSLDGMQMDQNRDNNIIHMTINGRMDELLPRANFKMF